MEKSEIEKKLDGHFSMICRLAENLTELEKKIRDLNEIMADFVIRQRNKEE